MRLTLKRTDRGSKVIDADTGDELSVLDWSLEGAGDCDALTVSVAIGYNVPALQPDFQKLPIDGMAWGLLEMIHGREKMETVLNIKPQEGPFLSPTFPQMSAVCDLHREAFGLLARAFGRSNPYDEVAASESEPEKSWHDKESLL